MTTPEPYIANRQSDCMGYSVRGTAYYPVGRTTHKLEAGFYRCNVDNTGMTFFDKMDVVLDDLVEIKDETTILLFQEFVAFWERLDRFAEKGLSAKRGILLWGPPGSGKTSAIMAMASHMIKQLGGVVIMADKPRLMIDCVTAFRQNEPDRPVIILYEDIDSLVELYGESDYLSMLDGEHQIGNVINLATTNYPERLDRRFADRPGRFDRVAYVGMPSRDAREQYLTAKLPDQDEVTRARWVGASDEWSMAHLRELIVAVSVMGESEQDAIERLSEMRDDAPSSDRSPDRQVVGFGS